MKKSLNLVWCAVAMFLMAVLLASSGPAWGQATTGQIVGTVIDPSGALVGGFKVIATNENTGVAYVATSTGVGEYSIFNVLAGVYDISANANGFSTTTTKGFTVDVNKTSTANFKLTLAAAAASIEVSTEASVALDTTTSQLQETYTTKELADYPIAATSVLNLSLLAPGVATSGGLDEGTGPSISGARARNNSFTVEGTDNNNKTVTGNVVNVQNDSVGEFTLLQNVFNAEYGHSNGGQFNVALKTGTNKFHGAAFEYFQNRNLNAIDNIQRLAGINTQPRFDDNRYGGQVGGPIVKDKLFFFFDYEQEANGQSGGAASFCAPTAAGYALLTKYRAGTPLTVLQQYLSPAAAGSDAQGVCNNYSYKDSTGTKVSFPDNITLTQAGVSGDVGPNGDQVLIPVGLASTPAPQYTNYKFITASSDYVISPRDTVHFRYSYDRQIGIDTGANLPAFFGPEPELRGTIGSLSETHAFTPNLLNELRIGFNRAYGPVLPTPAALYPGLSVFPNLELNDLGINLGPDANAPQGGAQNFFQLIDNITYVKGHHTLKFGFDGRKYISYSDFVQRARGDYIYSNTADLYLKDLSPDVLGQRNASGAISTRYYGDQTAFYGFGQDDWRVTSQLTVNYGMRYEFTSVPAGEKIQSLNSAASVPGLIVFNKPTPSMKGWAPRLGFAYAPDSITSIRGGFAIGYDVLFDNIGTTEAPPQQQVTENVVLTAATPGFLAGGALAGQAPPTYANVTAQRNASSHYVPNQFLPYAESWSLGIQHVFHNDYTAEVRYVGNHAVHLDVQQQINVQAPVTATLNLPVVYGTPSTAQIASTRTVATLSPPGTFANIIPAYVSAGFTSAFTAYMPVGASNYNGLQTMLTRRLKNGFLFESAYTWAKTMDNSTDDFNSTALNPRRAQDAQNYASEYSLSALSRKHRFTTALIYDVPFFKHSDFLLRNALSNWEVAPIYTYESGQFVTAQAGVDANLNGDSAGDRIILNPTGSKSKNSGVTPFYNPALQSKCPLDKNNNPTNCSANTVGYTVNDPTAYYVAAAPGTYATSGRSNLATPAINNVDMTAIKRIAFTERYSLEVDAVAYNVLNHAQYTTGSNDNSVLSLSTAGTAYQKYAIPGSTSFLNPKAVFRSNARTMTLAAKFTF